MQTHGPKEGSVMATESVATETRPADVGLRREMGLIGATWASETSIIGSGWLFGALGAAALAGAMAVLGWLIAGESISFQQMAGLGIIIAGLIAVNASREKKVSSIKPREKIAA